MPLLLNIDTATEIASVCITDDAKPLVFCKNEFKKEHASFVHTSIDAMLKETRYNLTDIDAFAVTSGPGSYTGLRVGMAAAKGFCYALSKPLITINTLEVMAKAAIDEKGAAAKDFLFCPLIDARRMEVFAAIYNSGMKNVLPSQPMILKEGIFDTYIQSETILFFGSGSLKLKQMQFNDNGTFSDTLYDARDLGKLAAGFFYKKEFADISYSAPAYFKDFHSFVKS